MLTVCKRNGYKEKTSQPKKKHPLKKKKKKPKKQKNPELMYLLSKVY